MGWLRKKIGQERRADESETVEFVVEKLKGAIDARGPDFGLKKFENFTDREKVVENKGVSADIEYTPGQMERERFAKQVFRRILTEELHGVEELDSNLLETEEEFGQAISNGEIQGKHEAQVFFDRLEKLKEGSSKTNGYQDLVNLSVFLMKMAEAENLGDQLPEDQVDQLRQVCNERLEMINKVQTDLSQYISGKHSGDATEIENELKQFYNKIETEEHDFIEQFESSL